MLLVLVSVLPVRAILTSKPRGPSASLTSLGVLGGSVGSILVVLSIPFFSLV
jgi:hypothetical protein